MNYLIDTHVIVWSLGYLNKISKKALTVLQDSETNVFASSVSFWEISLKFELGKLNLKGKTPYQLQNGMRKLGFKFLQLDTETAASFYKLPKHKNKDPFDRMVAWQAIRESMILISKDKGFDSYKKHGLRRIW